MMLFNMLLRASFTYLQNVPPTESVELVICFEFTVILKYAYARHFSLLCLMQVTDADFKSTVTVLAMSEEMMQELKTQYDENQAEILSILTQMAIDIPHYHDLNWRLDVKVSFLFQ